LAWKVEFHPDAARDLARLDPQIQRRIRRFIDTRLLKLDDPRQAGAALKGPLKGFWKYRVGDWRIICRLRYQVLTIYVVRIGNRREIYD